MKLSQGSFPNTFDHSSKVMRITWYKRKCYALIWSISQPETPKIPCLVQWIKFLISATIFEFYWSTNVSHLIIWIYNYHLPACSGSDNEGFDAYAPWFVKCLLSVGQTISQTECIDDTWWCPLYLSTALWCYLQYRGHETPKLRPIASATRPRCNRCHGPTVNL